MAYDTGRQAGGLAVIAVLAGVLCLGAAPALAQDSGTAVAATLRNVDGEEVGQVTYHPHGSGTRVEVRLAVVDLDAQLHGLDLHELPACDPGGGTQEAFQSAGGPWAPAGADHGSHPGDMPPVLVNADGSARASFVTDRFEPHEIVAAGAAQVLHAGLGGLGHVPGRSQSGEAHPRGLDEPARATGDAGRRYACGVVEGGAEAITDPPEGAVATGAGGTPPEIAPLPYVLFGAAAVSALAWSHVRTHRVRARGEVDPPR